MTIDERLAIMRAATKGPWETKDHYGDLLLWSDEWGFFAKLDGGEHNVANATAIAHARTGYEAALLLIADLKADYMGTVAKFDFDSPLERIEKFEAGEYDPK